MNAFMQCATCGKERELSEFYRDTKRKDGYQTSCKDCVKERVKANYRRNREYYAEYDKRRRLRPARKAKLMEYQRRRRERHPDKYQANTMVANAIKSGRLIKEPCVVCGKTKAEAHHPDYSQPLDVVWMCRTHHMEHHGMLVQA